MRNGWRVRWVVLVAAASAGACGSDAAPGNGITCGAGTFQSGSECVSQCGPGTTLSGSQCVPASAAGAAGASSAGNDGVGEAGTAAGGSDSSDAGAAGEGGSASGAGQSNAGSAGALAGNGGTAGVGGAGAGGLGGGGAAGSAGSGGGGGVATRWLTFSHSDGVFLYDTGQFPSPAGLAQISSHGTGTSIAVAPFSPDGKRLAYIDGGDLYVRDVSTSVPGPATLLLDEATAFDTTATSGLHCYWSSDSQSLAFVSGSSVYVLPVDKPAPSFQRRSVSGLPPRLAWSPTTNRLAISSSVATEVLQVTAGTITNSVKVDGVLLRSWSPDGKWFSATGSSPAAGVVLVDVSGAVPVVKRMTSLVGDGIYESAFDAKASTFAFATASRPAMNFQSAAPPDLYTVALKPTLGAPVKVSTGLDGWTGVTTFLFSPSGDRIAYLTQTIGNTYSVPLNEQFPVTYRYTVTDLAAGIPGASIALAPQSLSNISTGVFSAVPATQPVWQPDGKKLVSIGVGGFLVYDPSSSAAPFAPTSSFNSKPVFFGSSSIFGVAQFSSSLGVVDLADIQGEVGTISSVSSGTTGWSWSPDGKFIASMRPATNQPCLTRVDGVHVSTPVGIYPTGSAFSTPVMIFWQP